MILRIAMLIAPCIALQAEACSCAWPLRVLVDIQTGEPAHGPIEPQDHVFFRQADIVAVGTVLESDLRILKLDLHEVLKGDVPVGQFTFKKYPSNCAQHPKRGDEFLVVALRDLLIHQCAGGGTLGPVDGGWTRVHRQTLEAFRKHAR